ncbi:MAG: sigma-70 family RNA polymerase sigma factor [Rhodothermales bacterium]
MSAEPRARPSKAEVTQLLLAYRQGNPQALDQLMPLVYTELHRIAALRMRRERADHTLNATALVHEAYLKLMDQNQISWQNRAHFFAIASRVMRQVLISYARKHNADKRGGGAPNTILDGKEISLDERAEELVALDEALTRLSSFDERLARVVEYRFFGGLTIEETAEVLEVSTMTVKRDWNKAKAWLYRELHAS